MPPRLVGLCLDCPSSFTMISSSLRIRRVLKFSAPSWFHALRGVDSSTIMWRRSLVFYKKKKEGYSSMQCCRPRQAQQNKRDSHRRESRETSYKNRKRAPGQRNVPSTNNKKKKHDNHLRSTQAVQNKKQKKERRRKKYRAVEHPRMAHHPRTKTGTERKPKTSTITTQTVRDAAADGFRRATNEQKKSIPVVTQRAGGGIT